MRANRGDAIGLGVHMCMYVYVVYNEICSEGLLLEINSASDDSV